MSRKGYSCRLKSQYGVTTDWYCRNRKKLEEEVKRQIEIDGKTLVRGIEPDYHTADNDELWVTFPY